MTSTLERLLSADEIRRRVGELAAEISRDYADRADVLLVGVLQGASVFLADLIRSLAVPVSLDFVRASSYGPAAESSGRVAIRADLETPLTGRDVVVVEDIVDTGRTLNLLLQRLAEGRPRSLEVCALMDKPSRRVLPVRPRYVGFEIPDVFVVGYGMDYNEQYRQLPDVHYLDPPPPPARRDAANTDA